MFLGQIEVAAHPCLFAQTESRPVVPVVLLVRPAAWVVEGGGRGGRRGVGDKICELRRAFTVTVLGKRGLTVIMNKNKYVVWVARVGDRLIGSAIIGSFQGK